MACCQSRGWCQLGTADCPADADSAQLVQHCQRCVHWSAWTEETERGKGIPASWQKMWGQEARRQTSAAVAAGCERTVESLLAAALGPAHAVMALLATAAAGGAAAGDWAQQLLFLQEQPALAAATAVGSPFVATGICLEG
jgi:hypothetical protein